VEPREAGFCIDSSKGQVADLAFTKLHVEAMDLLPVTAPQLSSCQRGLCSSVITTTSLLQWDKPPRCAAPASAMSSSAVVRVLSLLRLRHRQRPYTRRRASPAPADLDVVLDEEVISAQKEEPQTERGAWLVLVHAEVRSCHMPFCKMPGLGKYVCSCLRDNVPPPEPGFGSAIQANNGSCTRSTPETAAYLQAAVPVLSETTAWDIATRLVQSAAKNTVGSAAVIGGPKDVAELYRQRLSSYGFWASVVPVPVS